MKRLISEDRVRYLIIGISLVIVATIWSVTQISSNSYQRYTIETGGALNRSFLIDKKTGTVWRYYVNFDADNNPIDEGFLIIFNP